jgi:hypothetical protein
MAKNQPKNVKQTKASAVEIMYTLFLGMLIALFFGLGVSAFYTSPKEPEYPTVLSVSSFKECVMSQEQIDAQKKYDQEMRSFQADFSTYNRNVSMITLGLAVIAMVLSLLFLENIRVLSNGALLGGVFTLAYSIIRGFMADDTKYRFIIVTVGLLITLALGYIKFIKPKTEK